MKNYNIYFIFAIALFGVWTNTLAQNENYIFTNKSRMLDNPAFVGFEEGYTIRIAHKRQWKDFNSQYLMLSGAVTDRVGVGLSINREAIFVQKNTGVFADFSYNIPVNNTDKLYFGFKAGGEFKSLDANNLTTYDSQGRVTNDPFLQSYTNKFQPNIGVGIQYKAPKFFVGVGIPKLLITEKVLFDALNRVTKVADQFKMVGLAGYLWNINDKIDLNPYAKFVYRKNQKDQIEIATTLSYNKLFEIGVSYRIQESASAFTLINIPSTEFQLGYGYQMYTSELSNYVSGSHEFMVQYKF